MAKEFQTLLLTGNSFRLLIFGTNLIACRCQCSRARRATAIARSPSTFWSLARHLLRHRRRYCPVGELVLSPPPSESVAVTTAAGEFACQRLLAVAAAGLPSQPSPPLCRYAGYWPTAALPSLATIKASSPRGGGSAWLSTKNIRYVGKEWGVWVKNGVVWAKNGGESCSP